MLVLQRLLHPLFLSAYSSATMALTEQAGGAMDAFRLLQFPRGADVADATALQQLGLVASMQAASPSVAGAELAASGLALAQMGPLTLPSSPSGVALPVAGAAAVPPTPMPLQRLGQGLMPPQAAMAQLPASGLLPANGMGIPQQVRPAASLSGARPQSAGLVQVGRDVPSLASSHSAAAGGGSSPPVVSYAGGGEVVDATAFQQLVVSMQTATPSPAGAELAPSGLALPQMGQTVLPSSPGNVALPAVGAAAGPPTAIPLQQLGQGFALPQGAMAQLPTTGLLPANGMGVQQQVRQAAWLPGAGPQGLSFAQAGRVAPSLASSHGAAVGGSNSAPAMSYTGPAKGAQFTSHFQTRNASTVAAVEYELIDQLRTYYASDKFLYACIGAQVWLVLSLCTACIYKANKPFPPIPGTQAPGIIGRQPPVVNGVWRNHIFQCLHVPQLCIFSCCCGPVRWADTMRMSHLLPFWVGFSLLTFFQLLGALGLGVASLFAVFTMVYFRQQVRKMFNINPCTCRTLTLDCMAYMCCSVCAMVQEARQVEEAWAFGHPSVIGHNNIHQHPHN